MSNLDEFNIDWNTVEEVSFEPLKAGDYGAKVTKSEFKDTKKGDKMLCITFDILGTKRKVFENYMFRHSNPKAVQAGQGKVKALAAQLGIDFDQLQDTSELHGKPVGVKVKIESSEQYGDQNRITSFFEYDDSLLEFDKSSSEDVKVDEVQTDDPEIVEDEPTTEEETVVEDTNKVQLSPEEIKGLKKTDFLTFIKENKITLDFKSGKKLKELKEDAVDALYGVQTVEGEEDIIIED